MAKFKSEFTPVALAKADKSRGRVVFNETCAPCHTLYGHGGSLGPDLTGAGRDNLDYLLEKLTDPSAVVTADFRMSIVNLNDGRVLNGIITTRPARTLTLKTITETQTIEHAEIESVQQSSLSMMPEGLLEGLTLEQRRDLIAYLMHKAQAPLPPSIAPENPVAE